MEITLLTVLGSIGAGAMVAGTTALVNIAGRLRIVEEDLAKERAYNRLLWVWSRSILDLYYRFRIDGSPDPPPLPEEEEER